MNFLINKAKGLIDSNISIAYKHPLANSNRGVFKVNIFSFTSSAREHMTYAQRLAGCGEGIWEKAHYKAPKVWIVLLDVNAGEMSAGVTA